MEDQDRLIRDFKQEAKQLAAAQPENLEKKLHHLEEEKMAGSTLEAAERRKARKAMREYWQHIMEVWEKSKRAA